MCGAEMAGTAMSFSMERTVRGQAQLPMAGISYVAVHPLRRRRGDHVGADAYQLDDLHARNVPVAGLGASEARIYGRFGYRHETWDSSWRLARGAMSEQAEEGDQCSPSNWSTWRRRETCSPPFMRKPAGPRWATCTY